MTGKLPLMALAGLIGLLIGRFAFPPDPDSPNHPNNAISAPTPSFLGSRNKSFLTGLSDSPNAWEMLVSLDQALEGYVSPGQFPLLFRQLDRIPPSDRGKLQIHLINQWAKVAPAAAFARALKSPNKAPLVHEVVRIWGKAEPEKAYEQVNGLRDQALRKKALESLIAVRAKDDLEQVLTWNAAEHPEGIRINERWAREDPRTAARYFMAREQRDPVYDPSEIRHLCAHWPENELDGLISELESQSSEKNSTGFSQLMVGLRMEKGNREAVKNPQRVLETTEDAHTRSTAAMVFRKTDPDAFLDWFHRQSPDHPAWSDSLGILVNHGNQLTPFESLSPLLPSLPEPRQRNLAISAAGSPPTGSSPSEAIEHVLAWRDWVPDSKLEIIFTNLGKEWEFTDQVGIEKALEAVNKLPERFREDLARTVSRKIPLPK